MPRCCFVGSAAVVAAAALAIGCLLYAEEAQLVAQEASWGDAPEGEEAVEPFEVPFDVEEWADLRRRLGAYREGRFLRSAAEDWSAGVNRTFLRQAIAYWAREYDWEATVRRLNKIPQFRTAILGLRIHFWHIRAEDSDAPAIIMLHGWPGSVIEFEKVTEMLKGKAHFVVPSLPGFGWSDDSTVPGLCPVETAAIFRRLMKRLGYASYFVQGGDWGSVVAESLARLAAPSEVRGLHLNMFPVAGLRAALGMPALLFDSAREKAKLFPLSGFLWRLFDTTGYLHEQATKPHTIGAALSDSPVALAAWILEKFAAWTDCQLPCDLGAVVPLDVLITNLMIYWTTNTATSSVRYYFEAARSQAVGRVLQGPIRVPVFLQEFPAEILPPPRSWVRWKYLELRSHRVEPHGGHFAALERPHRLAAHVEELLKLPAAP